MPEFFIQPRQYDPLLMFESRAGHIFVVIFFLFLRDYFEWWNVICDSVSRGKASSPMG